MKKDKTLLLGGLGALLLLLLTGKKTEAKTGTTASKITAGSLSYANYPKTAPFNNNPTNLISSIKWYGKTGNAANGTDIFSSMLYGIRAAIMNLRYYLNVAGWNTLSKITAKWSPYGHGGNNPEAYAQTISGLSGLNTDTILKFEPEIVYKIIRAMSVQEHSLDSVNDYNLFLQAWELAKKDL